MFQLTRHGLLRHGIALIAIAAAGLLTSWLTYRGLAGREARIAETQFRLAASRLGSQLERDLADGVNAVEAIQALFDASQEVTRREFREFAETILAQNDSLRSVMWAPRVAADDLERHEQEAREDGEAAYRVLQPEGAPPLPEGSDHFPAFYREPIGGPGIPLGSDLAALPEVREAILRAAGEGRTDAVSVALGKDPGDRCCIFVTAVCPDHARTAEGRREHFLGVAVAVARIEPILRRVVVVHQPEGIRVQLLESLSTGSAAAAVYAEGADDAQAGPSREPERIHEVVVLDLPGHRWTLRSTADESYFASRRTMLPTIVLYGGMLMTTLVVGLVGSLVGQRERVRAQVARRTADLQRAKEELEREVNEHARTQDSLRDTEAIYSSLVEALPVHLLRKDVEGRFIFANKLFCDLLGRRAEEILGKTDFDFYPPDLAEKYRHDDRRVMETRQVFEDVERNEKDGQARYVQVIKSPVYDAAGEVIGTQAIFWDVTERKQSELALQRERYLLSSLMEHVPDHIFFKDRESRFLRINYALARKFGLKDPAEAVGKTDFDFFTLEHAQQAFDDEQRVIATGQPMVGIEEKETWADGRVTWASTTKLPLLGPHGEIAGTFGISRDITEQRRAALALQDAKEAAEAASRAKSDFLANMSHEIRTPLNAIIGMTELLIEMGLTPVQHDYLRMVRDSGESLLSVINDILDFSKIEAGKLELDRVEFPLRERLGDTMKFLGMRAHGKGLELAYHVHADVPDGLLGDLPRLRQVIVNLAGNAIKFTDAGEVVLDVQCDSCDDDEVVLHFAVRDTGIGIAPEKMHTIFQAFEQADTSTTRRFGGTGLGLTISSRLVACMGGTIWAESTVGRGTTFHFTARFGVAYREAREPHAAPGVTLVGLKVLLVDDNATNRQILEEMLCNWQMQPTTAASGHEALGVLRRAAQAGQPFSILLSDVNMPGMDGFELAERVRRDSEVADTVIMMLTSGDRPGDLLRCERLRVAGHVIKPVKQSELFDAIVGALGATVALEPAAEETPRVRLPPLQVLLAEDSLVNQKLAVGLLEQHGHDVTVANNGEEALRAWQSRRFDVVLMDVQMPEKDGLETTVAIRQREARVGGHIPIVAMTAHALPGDEQKCLAAGMDAYVAKPIRARLLFETIARALGRTEETVLAPTEFPGQDVLDWPHALQTVRGDRQLLKTIVETFLGECPELTQKMRDAVAAGDGKALQLASHAIKGAIRYFGAREAFDRAFELENMGREGRLEGAAAVLEQFQRELDRVLPPLRQYIGRAE